MKPEIKKFFKNFGDCKIQYGVLNRALTYDGCVEAKENSYFVSGVKDTSQRANRDSIEKKNYFFIDYDIRENYKKKHGKILSDDELYIRLNKLATKLAENKLGLKGYNEYSSIVFTGNGYQFYYFGSQIEIDKDLYALGMDVIINDLNDILGDEVLSADKACKSIANLSRLPGTQNYSRNTKYGLPPIEARIIEDNYIKSRLASDIINIGQKAIVNKINKDISFDSKESDSGVMDAIIKISFKDIVCNDFGFTMASDNKNFLHNCRGGNQGLFMDKDKLGIDVLVNKGSHFLKDVGLTKSGYNVFSYIRDKNGLTNAGAFNRFNDNYPEIKEMFEKKKNNFKQNSVNKDNYKQNRIEQQEESLITSKDLLSGKRYSWGTDSLNKSFSLLWGGTYTVLAGESGDGKTTFAYFQAIQNAKLGHKVMYLSLEMSKNELLKNIGERFAGITKEEVYNKSIEKDKLDQFDKKVVEVASIKNLITLGVRKGEPTSIEVIKNLVSREKPDMLYLDNFDLITDEGNENENEKQRKISMKIMGMSSEFNIPIVLIHHYRKKSNNIGKGSKRTLDDIGGNRKITHDADNVVHLFRNTSEEATAEERVKTTVFLAKSRSGDKTFSDIYFDKGEFFDKLLKETICYYNN